MAVAVACGQRPAGEPGDLTGREGSPTAAGVLAAELGRLPGEAGAHAAGEAGAHAAGEQGRLLGEAGVRRGFKPPCAPGVFGVPAGPEVDVGAAGGACDQPILQFDGVSLAYGQDVVIRDVSFSVGQGRMVGVVGESGSGKTTLLQGAFGPQGDGLRLAGGRVLYAGKSVWEMGTRGLRDLRGPGLSCVFQDSASSFCPVRRIGAQVWEAVCGHERISRRVCDERLRGLLGSLGLPDPDAIMRAYPHELSGGMAQRVGIACALMLHPRVLLADEPTSALDASCQAQVIDALRQARDEHGCAIVLVTHNFALVEALCDEAIVLHGGRVVEHGPAHELLAHPQDAYTRTLVAAVRDLGGGEGSASSGYPTKTHVIEMPVDSQAVAGQRCRCARPGPECRCGWHAHRPACRRRHCARLRPVCRC